MKKNAYILFYLFSYGDPNKPNPILPGGHWDEDDFTAVERAKEALATLEGYTFQYLCNHDTLMNDLQCLKREKQVDIVLQLNDDGFCNHPRMELHTTAFLEMLNLPYTGSGPKCIGMTYDKVSNIQYLNIMQGNNKKMFSNFNDQFDD